MTRSIRTAIACLSLASVPAAAMAQKVNYDYDRTKNFSLVKTFALKEDADSDNPLVDRRIASAVAAELTARDMTQVAEDPDVFVILNRTPEMRKEITAYNTGVGPYYGPWSWHWASGWGTTFVDEREVRYDTLVVDMVDARSGSLIWRGTAVKRVDPSHKPDKVDRKVQKTVEKVMGNYPPPTRSE